MIRRVFTLGMCPTSKNVWQRMHEQPRARIKKVWEKAVWAHVNIAPRLPRPASRVTCTATVEWGKPGPLPDWHNLEMLHECVADGLVKAGILRDDANGAYVAGDIEVKRSTPPRGVIPQNESITTIRLECEYEERP